MKTIMSLFGLIALMGLSACSKAPDLDAPCPNFGRTCYQVPINAWDNEGLEQ